MKKKIHPPMYDVIIEMTNGKNFMTRSTYKVEKMALTYDPTNASLWLGEKSSVQHGRGKQFADKYGNQWP